MADFLDTGLGITVLILAQSLLVIAFVMISLLFLVYGDRKVWAAVQMRRGPNVVGPWGLLQSVADALKYVVKEVVIPAGVDRMNPAVFGLMTLTGSALWNALLIAAGVWLGDRYHLVETYVNEYSAVVYVIVGIAALLVFFLLARRARARNQARKADMRGTTR